MAKNDYIKNGSEAANPVSQVIELEDNGVELVEHLGLTKREAFAMAAMQGYLSMLAWSDSLDGGAVYPSDKEVARESVSYADALLKELSK